VLRLRVEERLSFKEIHDRTGAPKGSLSTWLRDHPLTDEERQRREASRVRKGAPKKDRGSPSKLSQWLSGVALSKDQKGRIAEAAVLFRLALLRMNPLSPVFDNDRTDWAVEVPETGRIWKLQVKCASTPPLDNGLPVVSLRHVPGGRGAIRYERRDFDFIIGYEVPTDTCYVWSFDEVNHLKSAVTITPDAAEQWDKLRK
jgi:PD-(D/E)XK endonuclease